MASSPKFSLSDHPIVVAIGVIAGVATICSFCIVGYTFLTGIVNTPVPTPPPSAIATDLPPTETDEPPPPTDIPITEPPIPPPTSTDTPPGTTLEVGEAWRQGGLELRVTGTEVYPKIILAYFTLTNIGDVQRVIEYSQDNFSAVDNLSRRIETGGVDWYFDPLVQHTCSSSTVVLEPTDYENILIYCERGNFEGVALAVDVTDNAITEIVITASGISSIKDARWRIQINH